MRSALRSILAMALLSGCYLSHGPSDPPSRADVPATDDAGRPRATPPPSRPGDPPTRDAGPPRATPPVPPRPGDPPDDPPDDPPSDPGLDAEGVSLCREWCDEAEAAACLLDGCYSSCVLRLERAQDVGCTAQWKATVACLVRTPCAHDGSCGDMNGWRDCIIGD